jgi:hypothetical protein
MSTQSSLPPHVVSYGNTKKLITSTADLSRTRQAPFQDAGHSRISCKAIHLVAHMLFWLTRWRRYISLLFQEIVVACNDTSILRTVTHLATSAAWHDTKRSKRWLCWRLCKKDYKLQGKSCLSEKAIIKGFWSSFMSSHLCQINSRVYLINVTREAIRL